MVIESVSNHLGLQTLRPNILQVCPNTKGASIFYVESQGGGGTQILRNGSK